MILKSRIFHIVTIFHWSSWSDLSLKNSYNQSCISLCTLVSVTKILVLWINCDKKELADDLKKQNFFSTATSFHWSLACFGLFLFLYLCFLRFLVSIIPKCSKSCYSPIGRQVLENSGLIESPAVKNSVGLRTGHSTTAMIRVVLSFG